MIENKNSSNFIGGLSEHLLSQMILVIGEDQKTADSSKNFRKSRINFAEGLLEKTTKHQEMAVALTLEYLVVLALQRQLMKVGFNIYLAPQSIECGKEDQKGIDVIIVDSENSPYLGINVKLRKGKSTLSRDSGGWNGNISTPYIYLSLGSLAINTKEKNKLDVKQWLTESVIPNIKISGKFPHFEQFQHYLIQRIEKSLCGLSDVIQHESEKYKTSTYRQAPREDESKQIFEEKIRIMHQLFSELKMNT